MDPVDIWVGASLVGALVSAWSFNQACGDLAALPPKRNGRRRIAYLAIFRELSRILIQVPNLALAVHALPLAGQIEWNVSLVILTLTPIILLASSLVDAVGRLRP